MSEEIRDLHNAVANKDDVIASTRPPATRPRDLDRMVHNVLAKLSVDGSTDVCEIGCGTGLLAVPLADTARSFIGVDFADAALAVLSRRLGEKGLTAKSRCVAMDFVAATDEEVAALGTFDRVLVYATLHLAGSETETERLFRRALALLRPGGLALFGNLPLADQVPIARPIRWQVEGFAFRASRRVARLIRREHGAGPTAAGLTPLNGGLLEMWATQSGTKSRWELPAVGTPMFGTRLDLLVQRAE